MRNVIPLIPVVDESKASLVISCDECAYQHTDQCDDCVVSFICDLDDDESVVLDAAEHRALRLLSDAGLTPELHLTAKAV
ncbi:MAG TPA: hypothetical protein VMY88_10295 [Acidimicrobiales bacterium]|nr:hypothetical protein [Acidimicrobiales bacterium]